MHFKNACLGLAAGIAVVLSALPANAGNESVTGTAVMTASGDKAPQICKTNSGVSRDGTLNNLTDKQCQAHATCTEAKKLATQNLQTYLTANGMAACTKYMSSTAPCKKTC